MKPSKFYPSIQGLRGISAVCVLFLHIYLMAFHGGFFPEIPVRIEQVWSSLGHGVPIFFIISGFVIPASLFRHGSLKKFAADRVLRIMPLFVTIHLAVFTIGPFIGYKWLKDIDITYYIELFVTNLTLTALPLGLPLAQQNSWTLTYEFGFYILIGAAWFLLRRWPFLRLVVWAVVIPLALLFCWKFPVCLYFLIGMAFAHRVPSLVLPRVLEAALAPALTVSFFYLAEFVSLRLAAIPASLLFWAACLDHTLTSHFLRTRFFQFLGTISFSLYLVHPIVIFPLQIIGRTLTARGFNENVVFAGYAVCALAATLAASVLSHRWIEVNLRHILTGRRWTLSWRDLVGVASGRKIL